MRHFAILLMGGLLTGLAPAQTLTEFGAAAAGSTAGSAAGKKVSDGITNVFGKVDQHTAAAAGAHAQTKSAVTPAPVLEVGPGTEVGAAAPAAGAAAAKAAAKAKKPAPKPAPKKEVDHSMVPPPPPITASVEKKPAAEPAIHEQAAPPPPVAPPPPPPAVTADDLRTVKVGEARADVLRLGPPASQITMFEDGHLLEIYSYRAKETLLGRVRLHDGSVDSVEVR